MVSRDFLLRACGLFTMAGLLASTASAQLTQVETAQQLQLNTITTAVPFLTIAPDSRSGALGDAGVALTRTSRHGLESRADGVHRPNL